MKRVPLLALLALAACATMPPPASAGPTAGLGEVARAGELSVRPLALLEDSRCPASVRCVWAGQVRIHAEIMSRSGREVREMTSDKPVTIAGGTLTLVEVEPPKVAPVTTNPRAYRFTFRFEGRRVP